MANSKFKATAELFLDTSNAKNDAKKFVTDLKQRLNSIETAADKMNVFKELVRYIGQADKALTALRTNNGDAFKHMFDGVDENFRKQFEDLFKLSGDNLQRLNVLREKLATLTPKSGIKEVRKFAKDLSSLYEAIGQTPDFNMDDFTGRVNANLIKTVTDAFTKFESLWADKISSIVNNFSIGGAGGIASGIQRSSQDIQTELDRLEQQNVRLGEIQQEFQKIKADFDKLNDGENVFFSSDTKFDLSDIKTLVSAFKQAKKTFDNFEGDKNSIEYYEIVLKYMQQAAKLKGMYESLTLNPNEANKEIMKKLKKMPSKKEKETQADILGNVVDKADSALSDGLLESLTKFDKGPLSDLFDQINSQMITLEDEIEKLNQATGNVEVGFDKMGQHAVSATEYIRGMTIAIQEMFNALSKASDAEYAVLLGGQNIAIKRAGFKEVSAKTTSEAYLANIMQDTDVDAHTHQGLIANINAPDFKQVIQRQYAGLAKMSAIIGDKDIVTLDLAKVKAEDAYTALNKLKELTNTKGRQSLDVNEFNKIFTDINPEYTNIAQRWDPSKFSDLATYIYNVKQSAQQAFDLVQRLQNLLIAISGKQIDFSKYEDLFKTLSVNNVGDVFNQIAKAEGIKEDGQILQVQDITSGSIQDVVADIQSQKDAFLELRQTAGVTYKEIAQAAKEYSKVYNKAEGQNFEFFKKYFHASEIDEIQKKFMDLGDGFRDLDGLTKELAMEFGIDPDEIESFSQVGSAAQGASQQLKIFYDLVDEIQNKSFDLAGNATDNLEVGQYIERLNSAKAILDELGDQGQLTAEQIDQVNNAFNAANMHLENSTAHYSGYGYGKYDYSYYEEYEDAMRENDELRQRNSELEDQLKNRHNTSQQNTSATAGNETQVVNSAQAEAAQLDTLLEKINAVKTAVNEKTQAFETERTTVGTVVKAEIESLKQLEEYLTTLQNLISNIFTGEPFKVEGIDNINNSGNPNGNTSMVSILQTISGTLDSIYGVLQGFTGIKAKDQDSVEVKKPVDESRLNHDKFSEQDLSVLGSILDAINGINKYLTSNKYNSASEGIDTDNNAASNIYTLLSSRLSQNLASERTLSEAVSLINLLLDKSKLEKDLATKATQYNDLQSFIRDNVPVLKAIGVNNNESAMTLWRNANYSREDFQPIEIAMEDAVDVIRNKVPETILDGWFRNADSGYKSKLENIALTDKDVRNAALNIMWDNYKQFSGKDIDFNKFLYSNIPVYRGKNQENYTDDDKVLSFTFDRSVAESFGKHILETVIRPIDTIGSYQTTAEGEVMVRKDYLDALPEFQTWLNNMSSGLKESFVQATSETSDIGSGSDYALEATLQSVKSVLESILNRMDVSEEQQIKPDAAVSEGSDNIIQDEQDGSGYALETTLQSVVTILNNILTGISISDGLSAFTQPLSDAVVALKNAADGIIQHQKAQKSDTRVAQARIEDPAQQDVIRQKAIDTALKLGSDVRIATLDSLTNGLVRVSGAFKNVDGKWEGFTVKVNEANEAVDLAINKQSAFAKSLKADDSNPYIYNKDEVEARAQKHLNEYAAQGKNATVQFKDSGRYTITILEEIDGLSKQIFQTFDENDDKIERTTVTMSNSQKMKLDALQKKLIDNGLSSGLISDKDQIYVDYQKASDELNNMTDAYSKLDDVSDDQISKWKQQIALVQQLGSQLTDLIKQKKLESDKKIFESDRSKKLSKFDLDRTKLYKDISVPDSFKGQIDDSRKAIETAADSDVLKVAINNWESLKNKINETAVQQDLYIKKTKNIRVGDKGQENIADDQLKVKQTISALENSLALESNNVETLKNEFLNAESALQGNVAEVERLNAALNTAKQAMVDLDVPNVSLEDVDKLRLNVENAHAGTESAKHVAEGAADAYRAAADNVAELKKKIEGLSSIDNGMAQSEQTISALENNLASESSNVETLRNQLLNTESILQKNVADAERFAAALNSAKQAMENLNAPEKSDEFKELESVYNSKIYPERKKFEAASVRYKYHSGVQAKLKEKVRKQISDEDDSVLSHFEERVQEAKKALQLTGTEGYKEKLRAFQDLESEYNTFLQQKGIDTHTIWIRQNWLEGEKISKKLKAELASATLEYEKVKGQYPGVEEKFLEKRDKFNKKESDFQLRKSSLENDASFFKDLLDKKNSEIDENKSVRDAIKVKLDETETKKSAIEAELTAAKEELQNINVLDNSKLIQAKQKLAEAEADLEVKKIAAANASDAYTTAINAERQAEEALAAAVNKSGEGQDDLADKRHQAAGDVTKAQMELDEANSKVDESKSTRDDAKAKLDEAMSRKAKIEAELVAAKEELQKKQNEPVSAVPDTLAKDLNTTKTSFDKYKTDIDDASGVTDELKTRLQELDAEFKNINDNAGLTAWQKKFKDLQTDINVERDIFKKNQEQQSKQVIGELNSKLKEAGLNKPIENPSADQQEILKKKEELIQQLNEYNSKVEYGQQAEISGIEQTKTALFGLIDAYKQKNNIVNANGNPSKQAYGTAQLLNQGAKYNSLVSRAQGVDLTGDFDAVKKLTDAYDKLKEAQSKFKIGEDLTTESGKAKVEAFKQAQIEFNRYAQELGKVVKEEEKLVSNSIDDGTPVAEDFQNTGPGRKKALEDLVNSIPKSEIGKFNSDFTELTYTVKNGDGTFTTFTATLNAAGTTIYATAGETEKATTVFGRFFDELKNKAKGIATYLISMTGFQEIFQQIRQGIQYVREIDSALTELKKVTDETDSTYDSFLQNMSKTASVVGSTVSELTIMAAEWARLGYSIKDAGKLAESTAILLNVSEFDNATEASEALISTMQAFSYTADESQHVVDILNEVGNNYAVSSDGLATALQDSASALMEGGNNLEQSVALIAAANKVVQDPNSVGSALRTISLRLRGTSTEV